MEVRRMADKKVGKITHYYGKIGVGIVDLSAALSVGSKIKISGKSDEFTQTVDSMEFEHKKINRARKGQSVGLKVDQKVHKGDVVYKVE
jgi:translation elongation factor EF-1alpha